MDDILIADRNGDWQDFVDHCFDYYDEVKKSTYRKTKIANIKESYRIYEQKEKKSNYPFKGASTVVLPMHTITVDNLEPRLVSGITGKKPILQFDIEGMTKQDPQTEIIQAWFNDELDQTVKIDDHTGTIVHKALLEGTVYPIPGYDEDDVLRRDFQFNQDGTIAMDQETGKALTEDKVDSVFKGGKIEYASFTDIFIADDADDWEKTDVIRITRPTYGELMTKKDKLGYRNIGKWLLKEESQEKLDDDSQSPAQSVQDVEKTGKETIECLECHMSYIFKKEDQKDEDVTDWEPERYVGLIAKESKCLIRMLPLRELNFKNEHIIKRIRMYKEQGRACGSSMYEKIKSIQIGASDIFNTVINVANLTILPWFFYSDQAGIDGEMKISMGEGIRCDDPSKIVFPKFTQNPRSYIVFIEMFMSLWEKLGSIGDIQIGRLSESRKDATATETMAAIQEGNIKHNYQSIAFKEEVLSLLRTIYDLYYQKMPFDTTFMYRGQQVKIPRAEMRRPFKFKLIGSTDLSNKVLEMQKNETMYTVLRKDPLSNPITLITNFVRGMKPDDMPEEYINPLINQLVEALEAHPELPQVIQQYLKEKEQKMAEQEREKEVKQADMVGTSIADALINATTG